MDKDLLCHLETIRREQLIIASERECIIDVLDSVVTDPVIFDFVEVVSGDGDSEVRYANLLVTQVQEIHAEVSFLDGLVEYDTPLYPVLVRRDESGFVTVVCRFFEGASAYLDPRTVTISIYDVVNPESVADFVIKFSNK